MTYYTQYYQENRERILQHLAEYRNANPVKLKLRRQQFYQKHKARLRVEAMKENYGATEESIKQFYSDCERQNGRCAICGEIGMYRGKPKLVYDHCHSTGQYRGAICGKCNAGIGMLGESKELLQKAANYISGVKYGNVD